MDTADIVTAAIALVALGISVWSVLYNRRSTIAAEVSSESSRRSAAAAERSATAAEAMLPPPPLPVIWDLEPAEEGVYHLRNNGRHAATDVRVVGLPEESAQWVTFTPGCTIPAGEAASVTVIALAESATVTSLRVTCAQQLDPMVVPVRRE